MNVLKEIEQIKLRLEKIESVLVPVERNDSPPPPQIEPEMVFEILKFEVQQSKSIIGPVYAYKVTVRNNSSRNIGFSGKIIYTDKNEFEVCSNYIPTFNVAAGVTFTKTGSNCITDENRAQSIADVSVEINPM